MIFGSGNILSHATVDMSSGLEGTFGQGAMTELLFRSGYQEGYSDQAAKVMGTLQIPADLFLSQGTETVLIMPGVPRLSEREIY